MNCPPRDPAGVPPARRPARSRSSSEFEDGTERTAVNGQTTASAPLLRSHEVLPKGLSNGLGHGRNGGPNRVLGSVLRR